VPAATPSPNVLPPPLAGRLAFVDALRGYAILAVIGYHCWLMAYDALPDLDARIARVLSHGLRGVQLFFLVSAFALSLSIHADRARNAFSLRAFATRRALRILPLYWLALLAYPWTDYPRAGAGLSWATYLSSACFLNWLTPAAIHVGVPGGWSVACEVGFYAMLPFLSARLRDGAAALQALVAALALRSAAYAWLERFDPPWRGDYHDWLIHILPDQLPVFLAGIVLYHAYAGGWRAFPKAASAPAWLGLGLYVAAACLWGFRLLLPGEYLFTAGFFALALALASGRGTWLVNRSSVFIGRISYSAYICHFLPLHWAGVFLLPGFAAWGRPNAAFATYCAVALAASLAGAYALNMAIEAPLQRLGRSRLYATSPP
jgi:peptidoglycan/LPS O-acetylase OafA/YrhL